MAMPDSTDIEPVTSGLLSATLTPQSVGLGDFLLPVLGGRPDLRAPQQIVDEFLQQLRATVINVKITIPEEHRRGKRTREQAVASLWTLLAEKLSDLVEVEVWESSKGKSRFEISGAWLQPEVLNELETIIRVLFRQMARMLEDAERIKKNANNTRQSLENIRRANEEYSLIVRELRSRIKELEKELDAVTVAPSGSDPLKPSTRVFRMEI